MKSSSICTICTYKLFTDRWCAGAALILVIWVIIGISVRASFGQAARRGVALPPSEWPPEAAGLRLHVIGNAHIDAPWLWPLSETNAAVHSTFRSALERLKEDPQVTMTTSSSQFYEWIADDDPAMLDEIRKRVAEGRWDLVGGWWVEPDVNIPIGATFKIDLVPHAGSWQNAGLARAAEKLVTEVPIIYQGIHPGTRPESDSFLSVDANDVVVPAVKQAEDGNGSIIRAYETDGRA